MHAVKPATKILIIRFSSIGDIVLTSPIIRCLATQFEGQLELHYITKAVYRDLVAYNTHIKKVHTIHKSTQEVMAELKAIQFNYVIDLHKNIRSRRLISGLNTTSFTFDKLNLKKWLLTTFKINVLPNVHIVDRYFDAVKALNITNDGQGLDFVIPPEFQVSLNDLPDNYQQGFVTVVIGAQYATKRLPTHKIIDICQKINQPIVLLGGAEDAKRASEIEKHTTVFNACGKYSIIKSASILQQSKAVITHDTGLMHIASALGIPIISIWGNTVPKFGMYPYSPNGSHKSVIIENKELSCRPCSKIGHQKCPKGHFKCMEGIDNNTIVEALTNVLQQ